MGPDQVRWVGSHLLRRPDFHSAPAPIELEQVYIADARQATTCEVPIIGDTLWLDPEV